MDLAGFQARFPEFRRIDPNMITLALADAAKSVSAAVFGAAYDTAHGLYAADLVWKSVNGGTARLEGDEPDPRSRYRKAFWELYLQYVPRETVA